MKTEGKDMDKIEEYILSLNMDSQIISKEEFEKKTTIKFFCPVIDTTVAKFLYVLMKALKPKKVLELGTSIGYSTTVMALALKEFGGKITTIEKDKAVAQAAQKNFKQYYMDRNIDLLNEDVFKILPELSEEYDVVFLDIYNGLYPEIMDECIRLLKKGGILIVDDTLFPVTKTRAFFIESNKKVDEFNKLLSQRKDMDSILLPFDDGITLAVKR